MEDLLRNGEIKKVKKNLIERVCISHSIDSMADELQEDIRERISRKIRAANYRLYLIRLTSVAATIAILVFLGAYFYMQETFSSDFQVKIETTDGEIRELILPDQSKVLLNAGSIIEYHSKFCKNREVKLSGEAFFDVTHDSIYPFTVRYGKLNVKVYGTKFNVQSYDELLNTAVTLVEGRVSIKDCQEPRSEEIYLNPGEQAVYNRENNTLIKRPIDADLYISWMDGDLYFEKNNFDEVAAILSRRFKKEFVITSDKLKKITFTGQFKSGNTLDEILHIISWDNRIRYSIKNDSVYVYEK